MSYGLLGASLSHSYSKEIHEAMGKYEYELFCVSPEDLPSFFRKRNFEGLNVTIPYKKDVMAFCDFIDPAAEEIGSVNTLYFKNGALFGANTDHSGFIYMVKRSGISVSGKKVLVLGSGGVSLAVKKALEDLKAREILTASRKKGRGFISYADLPKDAEIIINATPSGMFPDNTEESIIDLSLFKKCIGVFDLIYNPFVTPLLFGAAELNIPASNGLPMLVAQATAAAELFTGADDLHCMNEILIKKLIAEKENIVLVGMPGCGKTTVGQLLAKKLDRIFVDTDEEISISDGKSAGDIIIERGEVYFRELETSICKELGKRNSLVIATGGGAVLKKENIRALKQNGKIIFIERPIHLLSTKGRPLSQKKKSLRELYENRISLYDKYSDISIKNDGLPEESVVKILEFLDLL
jgi:shikimate dehydrogenase